MGVVLIKERKKVDLSLKIVILIFDKEGSGGAKVRKVGDRKNKKL